MARTAQLLTQTIHTLYSYNRWANERVLAAAVQFTNAQFANPPIMGQPSIRDLLVHILNAQRTWLIRCQELRPPSALKTLDFPDLKSLRQLWNTVEMQTQGFIASLDDATLARTIRYLNDRGEPNSYPLWQVLIHQVTHANQHRSEVALMLTQLGHSPGWLDFLVYIDTHTS